MQFTPGEEERGEKCDYKCCDCEDGARRYGCAGECAAFAGEQFLYGDGDNGDNGDGIEMDLAGEPSDTSKEEEEQISSFWSKVYNFLADRGQRSPAPGKCGAGGV